jgi:drug/metabolite transporter (DMT)-like permease
MLLAVTLLTAMFAILKHMANELPFWVVALVRTAIALVLFTPWLARVGIAGIATRRIGLHFLRAFFGTASFACVVYALGKLLLSDTMVLSFTAPFWSIIISALLLGEVIRRYRIVATIIGFIGVLMVVKPQGNVDPAMLFAVGSALFTAAAMVSMKSLSSTEPPTRIVFWFFIFGTLLLLPPAMLTWQTPNPVQLAWLAGSGILGAVGQNFLARAYAAAEVGVVAPLDFVRLVLAALLGFLVFDEIPDAWSGAGTAVIIAASLYIAYIARREAKGRASAT